MCTWRVLGSFDAEGDLLEIQFTELVMLPFWIEYYAEFADCPEPLAGIG